MSHIKIGVIGGSGLEGLSSILDDIKEKSVVTPFGKPSDVITTGKIRGVDCTILARHGRQHNIAPTDVNYRANVWALKEEGCTHIVATTVSRSLQGFIHPTEIILIDDFIDRTTQREDSFYDGTLEELPGISHVPMNEPFCPITRGILAAAMESLGYLFQDRGTVITVEGPRMSTWAESRLWREWRADIINMTTVPEVVLAKEAGLLYASMALVTEYDTWRDDSADTHTEQALKRFQIVTENAIKVIAEAVPKLAEADWTEALAKIQETARQAIMK